MFLFFEVDFFPSAHFQSATKIPAGQTKTQQLQFKFTARSLMANDESSLGNALAGCFFGALAGGGLGLGSMLLFDDPPFFPGDTVLIGALLCGVLGLCLGAGFIEWLKESWLEFWF